MTATHSATCECPKGDLDTSPGLCECGRFWLNDGSATKADNYGGRHSKYFCVYQWDPLPECEARANG